MSFNEVIAELPRLTFEERQIAEPARPVGLKQCVIYFEAEGTVMSSLKKDPSKSGQSSENSVQHIVPQNGRWAVRGRGRDRATSVHRTQAEAIEAAKKIARDRHSQVVIHGRDGHIRHTVSESPADELMFRVWEETYKDRS